MIGWIGSENPNQENQPRHGVSKTDALQSDRWRKIGLGSRGGAEIAETEGFLRALRASA